MMPGMPERLTRDYAWHGVTSLFAAFNIAGGTVIFELHRQHRAVEFKKFLIAVDKAVPAAQDVLLSRIAEKIGLDPVPVIDTLSDEEAAADSDEETAQDPKC